MKFVFMAWGQPKRWFELLALGEMCFEGMGTVAKAVEGVGTGLNVFLRAWGELKGGFEVLALGESCFRGHGRS